MLRSRVAEQGIRNVGVARATMRIGLANIVYNMRRFLFLERISAAA